MKNGKKRRAWTSVQVRELKTMARKKSPAAKIAKKLKRSEGATRQKAFSIGLSLELARLTGRSLICCSELQLRSPATHVRGASPLRHSNRRTSTVKS